MKVFKDENGVDCFVYLEQLAPDKGAVINILTSINPDAPEDQREYVNNRNWIGAGDGKNEAANLAAKARAKALYEAITEADVRQRVADAKDSIKPAAKEDGTKV